MDPSSSSEDMEILLIHPGCMGHKVKAEASTRKREKLRNVECTNPTSAGDTTRG